MEHVSVLLIGGTVITMNDAMEVIQNGAVAIKDETIVAIGPRDILEARYTADTVVDCQDQYILPGLVNAHTHVPMTLLRGLADDLRLDVWLMGYIMPVEREFVSPEFCRLGTQLACAEMIRSGVTSFADMYYFEADIAKVVDEVGMRAMLCESVLKFPSPDAPTYEDSLAYTRQFIEDWRAHPRITPTVAPHAPYSNTRETLEKCTALAQEFDMPLMIHLSETKREVDDNVAEYGMRVMPWVEEVGVFSVPTIAAHCVHVEDQEIHILHKNNVSVAHCPSANLKLASGIAPVSHMLDIGVNVAIGTDGPASNNDLDMFEEMRLAALLAKVAPHNPTAVPAQQALAMATRNGAKALGLEGKAGILAEGLLADIIVVDANNTHNMPHFEHNPTAVYSQLVYACKSTDVRHTICHGQFLMRDRQLTTLDEAQIAQQAAAYASEVGTFLSQREENTLSKLIAVGIDVERAESFEVQTKAVLNDPSKIEDLLSHEDVEVIRAVHYRQYDTYFLFNDQDNSRVRYREDDGIDADGNVTSVRMRLTYTSGEKERSFHDSILLSHSRFIAPASHPLRFYEEFFKATDERHLQKERRRWHIHYQGTLYYVNLDRLIDPEVDQLFVEIKARTWSQTDAEHKADDIRQMMHILGVDTNHVVSEDYLDMQETL
ncbi:amidohydrolase family protein [Phototrophicus methaneseepsis]|nr:amidohydrolase family protein [Phototrophicus methaneseepsis]